MRTLVQLLTTSNHPCVAAGYAERADTKIRRPMRKSWFWAFGGDTARCIVASALLSSCISTPEPAPGVEVQGLVRCAVRVRGIHYVAALLPYEGKLPIGSSLETGLVEALDEINRAGGVTEQRVPLGLVVCNTKGEPATAVQTAGEVVQLQPQVLGMIGPIEVESFDAVARETIRLTDVAIVSPVADSPQIQRISDRGNVFRFGASLDGLAKGMIANIPLEDSVAVFNSKDADATGLADAVKEKLAANGRLFYFDSYDTSKANFQEGFLQQVENFHADDVVLVGFSADATAILRESVRRGYRPPKGWVLPPWLKSKRFVDAVDAAYLEGAAKGAGASFTRREEHILFSNTYENGWTELPDVYIDHFYDATYAIAMAIHRADSTTRIGVRDSLQRQFAPKSALGFKIVPGDWSTFVSMPKAAEIDFYGATGVLTLNDKGDRAVQTETWTFRDGTLHSELCVAPGMDTCE